MRLSYSLLVVAATLFVTGNAATASKTSLDKTLSLEQVQNPGKRFLRKHEVADMTDDNNSVDEERIKWMPVNVPLIGTSKIEMYAGRSAKLDKKLDKMLTDEGYRTSVFKSWHFVKKYKAYAIHKRLKVADDDKYAEIYNMYGKFLQLQHRAGMHHMTGP